MAPLIAALSGVLVVLALWAGSAGAVLVDVGHGQVAGILPRDHVRPASIPGSFARHAAARKNFADSGTLTYHGGVVLHGSSTYLIFWDPNNEISAGDEALYERYMADSAADSGKATNVFAVAQQFTDMTGFVQYHQVFAPDHAITDTQKYPAAAVQCTENGGFTEKACLFDSQIQAEVQRVITANGLATGVTGDPPIYFVVTPPDVNSCFADDSTCADDFFCAYHSNFDDGANPVLYSDIATVLAKNDPKGCQFDGNAEVQQPNGQPIADVALKALSHEFNETITDPVDGGGWYATSTGQENGDECNFFGSPADPGNDLNSNAFKPYLGGTAAGADLFNQLINGNDYYTQSEWSNGGLTCRMRPTSSALAAAFTAPGVVPEGTPVSFDPAGSSSAGGFTSATWSFGDGVGSFARGAPATISHSFLTAGTYTVALTLVDTFGNVSTVSHTIEVSSSPPAPVTVTPTQAGVASTNGPTAQIATIKGHAVAGVPFRFDGSRLNDTGSTLIGYGWHFGDGGSAGGGSPRHTFKKVGTYTVSLTVTDASGQSSTSTGLIVVKAPSIRKVRVEKGKKLEQLKVALSGPGLLKFGSQKFTVRRPRTVTITVTLSGSQRARLARRHKLTVRYRLSFVPTSGKTGHRMVRIKL